MGNIKNRKAMVDLACKVTDLMDPSGHNTKVMRARLGSCTDKEFDYYMAMLKDGKEVLSIETPNMIVTLHYENIEKAAKFLGVEFFHHLHIKDSATGVEYITPEKAMILELPFRRLQQTIYEKLSVPTSDRKIDGFTGQVTGDDRSSSITQPEIQALDAQGFKSVLEEFVVAKGGNINAYAKMKQSLEETGEATLADSIDPASVSRSTAILDAYLLSMGYESNLLDKSE